MKRSLRSAFPIALALTLVAAAGVAHTPPPALGPPDAPPDAAGGIFLTLLRVALEDEGEAVIEAHNAGSPHKLSWAPGARPTDCGYDCFGPPSISATRNDNRPNERIAKVSARLEFKLDIANLPFTRRVISNVEFVASCRGWDERGGGRVALRTRSQPPFVSGGSGPSGVLEDVLDFFAGGNLTAQIDSRVRAQLGGGTSELDPLPFPCRSLGVFSNFGSGNFSFDAITWDLPEPPEGGIPDFSGQSLSVESAIVTFKTIRRVKTLSAVDPDQPLTFDIYVNGRRIDVPVAVGVVLPVDGEQALGEVRVRLPLEDLESLQVIVADSLGGAAWSQFGPSSQFGKGTHLLQTHRTELLPVGSFPGGFAAALLPAALPGSAMPDHLKFGLGGDGLPGADKPMPMDIHDFETEYSIFINRPVVGEADPRPARGAPGARVHLELVGGD